MFIWTTGDAVTAFFVVLAILFYGGIFATIKIGDWRRKRRKR